MQDFLIAWGVAWICLWAVVYLVTDAAQRYLYDEVVPYLALRSLAVTLALSLLLTWLRPFSEEFDLDMMILIPLVHWALWFPAVWLVLRYQWHHAIAVAGIAVGVSLVIAIAIDRIIGAGGAATV